MRKEAVEKKLRYYPSIRLNGLRDAGMSVTLDFPNMKQFC
jgi:hypothetical protein